MVINYIVNLNLLKKYMIFISHTHSDKVIVEPIALELSKIYGKEKVFYDSWSMKPGDSILGTMEKGLQECSFFIIFVSKNSLDSQMVSLEWKSGLTKKMRQSTKFIPVILDGSDMPLVLTDILGINLYKVGIDRAIGQLVNIISNKDLSSSLIQNVSNLEAEVKRINSFTVEVICVAKYYFEPVTSFIFELNKNLTNVNDIKIDSLTISMLQVGTVEAFNERGNSKHMLHLSTEKSLAKGHPFIITISSKIEDQELMLISVHHEEERGKLKKIPMIFKN